MARFLPAVLKLRQDPFRFLKSLGFSRANKSLWDAEYADGHWDYLDTESTAVLIALIEKYARGGRILDLGCGTTQNLLLDNGSYSQYVGVDISEQAIARARALGRPKSDYAVADASCYEPQGMFDVILLKELITYLPAWKVVPLLERLARSLTPDGVLIVEIWSVRAHPRLVARVERTSLPLLEKAEPLPGGVAWVFGSTGRRSPA